MQLRRRALVNRYRTRLAVMPGIRTVPGELATNGADHLMIVVLPIGVDRDDVRSVMGAEGVATSVHFRPLHRFAWFAGARRARLRRRSVAESLAERVLSLPLHPGLGDADVDRVVESLGRAVGR